MSEELEGTIVEAPEDEMERLDRAMRHAEAVQRVELQRTHELAAWTMAYVQPAVYFTALLLKPELGRLFSAEMAALGFFFTYRIIAATRTDVLQNRAMQYERTQND